MSSSVVQVRVDDVLRMQATSVAEQLGLDLPTAIRVFLTRMVADRAIPFRLALPQREVGASDAIDAMYEMGRISAGNGNSQMMLAEIDAEIAASRAERRMRLG